MTRLSPATAVAGSASLPLTITGTKLPRHVDCSFRRDDADADPTASATSLTVTVPAAAVAYARTVPVIVNNGTSSGHSAPTAFTITPMTAQVFYRGSIRRPAPPAPAWP